jgi:hypothetical protein
VAEVVLHWQQLHWQQLHWLQQHPRRQGWEEEQLAGGGGGWRKSLLRHMTSTSNIGDRFNGFTKIIQTSSRIGLGRCGGCTMGVPIVVWMANCRKLAFANPPDWFRHVGSGIRVMNTAMKMHPPTPTILIGSKSVGAMVCSGKMVGKGMRASRAIAKIARGIRIVVHLVTERQKFRTWQTKTSW